MLLHTEDMTWNPKTRRLSIDSSDCGLPPGKIPKSTINVVSHRTGKIQMFRFFTNHFLNDELVGWIYESTDELVPCSLEIFND